MIGGSLGARGYRLVSIAAEVQKRERERERKPRRVLVARVPPPKARVLIEGFHSLLSARGSW